MNHTIREAGKSGGWKLADGMLDEPDFRVGPDLVFAESGSDGDGERFVCADASLGWSRRVTIVGDALVIKATLTNEGQAVSPPIDQLEPLCLAFEKRDTPWRVIGANGGTTEGYYPPSAYRTIDQSCYWHQVKLESHPEGRSSNLHLPLAMVLDGPGEEAEGFFVGMEWSATWYIQWDSNLGAEGRLRVGIKTKGLRLEAGESIELPAVHLGFFRGGGDGGTNALRRYLYENVCARYQGQPTLPKVSYDHWFHIANGLSDEVLRKQADRAAELGVETFVVDAAWFPGDFPNGVGNWHGVNAEKFPQGLEALADHVRSLGMVMGLWFEPERAVSGTSSLEQHPEMFVKVSSWSNLDHYHINLARRDAQDYLIETVGGWIERLDLHWSRWDYNTDPRLCWEALDPTGKIQFAYMEGLYRVLDTLMREHPNWMVEGCASGGRRIDIGTMRRAHTYWFSDHTDEPALCRYMQARANRFLPGHLCNSSVAVHPGRGDRGYDDTAVLSRMLGKLAFDGDIASWSPGLTARAARLVDGFKQVRHLLVQDFYQLSAVPSSVDDWDIVQFCRYDGREAALFAFAGRGGMRPIPWRGLVDKSTFTVTRAPDGESVTDSGRGLKEFGLPVELAPGEGGLWIARSDD